MTETVKITAISVVTDQKPWKTGDKLLAFFDTEFDGIRLRKCLLVRTSRGFLLAQPPRGGVDRAVGRPVEIMDRDLRVQMAEAAHKAFVAIGGVEEAA